MATCKDCLHFEVCAYFKADLPCCVDFKDSAEWVERPKGRWIIKSWWQHKNNYQMKICSVCNHPVKPKNASNFCPNCGADMRGTDNDV